MTGLAVLMIAVFLGAGAIHAVWGLGLWWPIRDETRLARAVVGDKGIIKMPAPVLSFGVTAMTCLGALWVCFLMGWIQAPVWLTALGGWAISAVLLLRGAATYTRRWLPWDVEPMFDHLDRTYFAPLILFLGLGTLILLGH